MATTTRKTPAKATAPKPVPAPATIQITPLTQGEITLRILGSTPIYFNAMSRKVFTRLKVYAGPEHPHAAQNPQPLIAGAEQKPA